MSVETTGTRHDDPVYVISVAASIAGMHPQTLRQYDRLGLVSPQRTGGRNRLYSSRDIDKLREVARLSAAGINLAGIARILELEEEVGRLQAAFERATAGPSTALVVWRPHRAARH